MNTLDDVLKTVVGYNASVHPESTYGLTAVFSGTISKCELILTECNKSESQVT